MGTPIIVAEDIRGFIRRVYAETASSIGQVFDEDGIASSLPISHVRVCCGTDPVNRSKEGDYKLPDNTPWLAELYFKKGSLESVGSNAIAVDMMQNEGSAFLSRLPTLRLQGVGMEWERRFAKEGVITIGDLARLPRKSVFQLASRFGTRQVIEFHAKALLATAPFPHIPECSIMDLPIFDLLQKEITDFSDTKSLLSEKEINRLTVYLSTLISVLDDQVFDGIVLRQVLL